MWQKATDIAILKVDGVDLHKTGLKYFTDIIENMSSGVISDIIKNRIIPMSDELLANDETAVIVKSLNPSNN